MSAGVFIAATDTGVGKTYISCRLAEALRSRNARVGVFKPFASGSWRDTRLLLRAAGRAESPAEATPVYISVPVAPAVSFGLARTTRRTARAWAKVRSAWDKWRRGNDVMVVEGSGGALVPIWKGLFVADLPRIFRLPVWVAARPRLGTLNHTLLTLEAFRRRGAQVRRIILTGKRGSSLAERTNPSILRKLTGLPVTILPWGDLKGSRLRLARAWSADFG